MNERKYVLFPGYGAVTKDGRRQYIIAAVLADLYGVSMRDCILFMPDRPCNTAGMIELHPRDDGDYSLPEGE